MMKTNTRLILATTMMVMLFAIGIASAVTLGEPSASFSASGTKGAYPLSVTFSGQAINMTEPFSYHWDFGDGSGAEKTSVSTISPITHVYLHPGKYTVSLAVYDIGFPVTTWVSSTKTDYITVTNPPPVVSISGSPLTINAGDRVDFSSVVSGNGITSYVWNFGDGKSIPPPGAPDSIISTTSNIYEANGTYTAHLLVTNDGGTTTSNGVTIIVHPKAPVADFEATSARTGAKPFAVTFEDKTRYDGSISSYAWTFGDGGTATTQNPMHVYLTNGTYTVGLTVSTISGPSTETKEGYIVVLNSPVVCPTPVPTVVPTVCPTPIPIPGAVADKTGVYRPGVGFFLKMDSGNVWSSTDLFLPWDNAMMDLPVSGDWNADGLTETGVYRPGAGFYLKMDQGTTWSPSTDKYLAWDNAAGDLPISGNWNTATIATETGVYRPGSGMYLKMDQTGTWNSSTDQTLAWDNAAGDLPVSH